MNPCDCKYADSSRARGVKSGMIGVGSGGVADDAVKYAGRRTRLGGNE